MQTIQEDVSSFVFIKVVVTISITIALITSVLLMYNGNLDARYLTCIVPKLTTRIESTSQYITYDYYKGNYEYVLTVHPANTFKYEQTDKVIFMTSPMYKSHYYVLPTKTLLIGTYVMTPNIVSVLLFILLL